MKHHKLPLKEKMLSISKITLLVCIGSALCSILPEQKTTNDPLLQRRSPGIEQIVGKVAETGKRMHSDKDDFLTILEDHFEEPFQKWLKTHPGKSNPGKSNPGKSNPGNNDPKSLIGKEGKRKAAEMDTNAAEASSSDIKRSRNGDHNDDYNDNS